MIKTFQVYKQVFKFKVSFNVVGMRDYLNKDGIYMGMIHAISKPDAADNLKKLLDGALSNLNK